MTHKLTTPLISKVTTKVKEMLSVKTIGNLYTLKSTVIKRCLNQTLCGGRPKPNGTYFRKVFLYRHSRMFAAGIYSFTDWIPAKNIPE